MPPTKKTPHRSDVPELPLVDVETWNERHGFTARELLDLHPESRKVHPGRHARGLADRERLCRAERRATSSRSDRTRVRVADALRFPSWARRFSGTVNGDGYRALREFR